MFFASSNDAEISNIESQFITFICPNFNMLFIKALQKPEDETSLCLAKAPRKFKRRLEPEGEKMYIGAKQVFVGDEQKDVGDLISVSTTS